METAEKQNSKRKNIALIVVILAIILLLVFFLLTKKGKNNQETTKPVTSEVKTSAYRLSSNSLEDFDLYFMQLENNKENMIYSPLSIKYALEMLEEGANGESKDQITNIIGEYKAKKYTNSENMSFANAMFIKDTNKNSIKSDYVDNLKSKYNAEVLYDSFKTPNTLNTWVSNKTFKLIDNLFDDISTEDFILVNALAIDMEWVNKIQNETKDYRVSYAHRKYWMGVSSLVNSGYHSLEFKNSEKNAKSVQVGAVINKYDIVNTLGEDKIRETVSQKYQEWLSDPDYESRSCNPGKDPDVKTYVDTYIKEINEGYKDISSSTDFLFYDDDSVKAFAKDLKEYNGTTLQYIGIMPKKDNLDNYIKNIKSSDLNTLINNLKSIELDNFKEGVITEINGYIPMFKFDYELNLMSDLNKLGIADIFDINKSDLSNLTSDKAVISSAVHKANIEFSNDGIKAAAATAMGGKGAGDCGFDYLYDVPVEKIDLTFDNPYLFIIRDKNSGEVWFTGTVYKPVEYVSPYPNIN